MNRKVQYAIVFWLNFIGLSVWDFYQNLLGNEVAVWKFWLNFVLAIAAAITIGDE